MSPVAITVTGSAIEPLRLAYAEARAKKRSQGYIGLLVLVAAIAVSAYLADVRPGTIVDHADRLTAYVKRLCFLDTGKPVWSDVSEWFWGFRKWLGLIGETIVIAYLGTVIGFLGAFVFSFLAASNLVTNRVARSLVRRFLEFCRTVPELVFALLFVASFGLGPLPGVLALAIHSLGALGKQFAEVVENADMKPFDGVTASGGSWVQAVRFAMLPQVLSNFASYGLLRFEINVRESAILGFVGAGGIGDNLLVAVRRFYYSDVSAIVLMIIATVTIIDLVTQRIRHHLIGREGPQ